MPYIYPKTPTSDEIYDAAGSLMSAANSFGDLFDWWKDEGSRVDPYAYNDAFDKIGLIHATTIELAELIERMKEDLELATTNSTQKEN